MNYAEFLYTQKEPALVMIDERRIGEIESTLQKVEDKIAFIADGLKLHRRETLGQLQLISNWESRVDYRFDHLIQSADINSKALNNIDKHCLKIAEQLAILKENINLLLNTADQRHQNLDLHISKVDRRFDTIGNRFDQIQKLLTDQFLMMSKNMTHRTEPLHSELKDSYRPVLTKHPNPSQTK